MMPSSVWSTPRRENAARAFLQAGLLRFLSIRDARLILEFRARKRKQRIPVRYSGSYHVGILRNSRQGSFRARDEPV